MNFIYMHIFYLFIIYFIIIFNHINIIKVIYFIVKNNKICGIHHFFIFINIKI